MIHYERQVDALGRVVFPAELLKGMGVQKGDFISLSRQGDKVVVETKKPCCRICGTEENLLDQIPICASCAEKIKVLDK